jgi:N-methylhydantoinase B
MCHGGGYGSALERDPTNVLADVRNGYVSCAAAFADYGVALVNGSDGLQVDTAATRAARGASPF